MDRQFLCSLFFNYEPKTFKALIGLSLDLLGFEPKIMRIHIAVDDILEDIPFDENLIFSSLEKGASTFDFRNKIWDDEGGYKWVRLTHMEAFHLIQVTWSNDNLDFLLEEDRVDCFFRTEEFICAYCYDDYDRYEQSQTRLEYYVENDPGKSPSVKTIVQTIDISEHWGRSEEASGLKFMAAPLMWFGKKFFGVIPKADLLGFRGSSLHEYASVEIVAIKLFDVYDLPEKPENRGRQEEFWRHFDLENVISKYKAEHEIDSFKALMTYLKKGKGK